MATMAAAAAAASSMPAPSSGVRTDAFLTRIVVMVDEATEPTLPDEDAARRRAELVAMANSAAQGPGPSAAGANIAYAIRKRLKSDDSVAVMNTLKLLDELMRSCPYFYRYVADDKMFRRLWRFVVPDYKNGVRVMLSLRRTAADLRATAGRPDIAVKVLILIRAWAEELSVMYNGKYDPSAGFLIERYNSKRVRVKFPDVPRSELPWVCPVGPNANQNAANVYSLTRGASSSSRKGGGASAAAAAAALPESLGLREVENTVNLFENILENAASVDELRTDVSKDLATRCRLIGDNLDRLSMSMSKEDELTRAIKVSEKLRRALDAYDNSLRSGSVVKPIPVVAQLHDDLDSDHDELYEPSAVASSSNDYRSDRSDDVVAPRYSSAGKSSRPPSKLPRAATASRFAPPEFRGLDRSRSHDSHLDLAGQDEKALARERREEAQRRFHREYVASKRGQMPPSRRPRERSTSPVAAATEERRSERTKSKRREDADDEDVQRKGAGERSRSKRRDEEEEEKPRRGSGERSKSKRRDEEEEEKQRRGSGERSKSKRRDDEEEEKPRRGSGERTKSKKRDDSDDDSEDRVVQDGESSRKSKSKRETRRTSSLHVSSSKPPRKSKAKDASKRRLGRAASALPETLVDIGASGRTTESEASSDDAATTKKTDTFARLGQRYDTHRSDSDAQTSTDTEVTTGVPSVNIAAGSGASTSPPTAAAAAALYQTAPYGGVVMMPVPNPMAMGMYNSVNPMMGQNPLLAAYNTINPALFYNTVNPMAAYATHNPALAMGGQFGNPYMSQQAAQLPSPQPSPPPQQSATTLQTPQPAAQLMSPPQIPQQTPMLMAPGMPGVLPGMPTPQQTAISSTGSPQQVSSPYVAPQTQMMPLPPSAVPQTPLAPPPPPPPPPAVYTTVTNAPAPPPNAPPPPAPTSEQAFAAYQSVNMGPTGVVNQAAAYQQTMANAAAMYQAAAAAYQSVSGHAPLPVMPQAQTHAPVAPNAASSTASTAPVSSSGDLGNSHSAR